MSHLGHLAAALEQGQIVLRMDLSQRASADEVSRVEEGGNGKRIAFTTVPSFLGRNSVLPDDLQERLLAARGVLDFIHDFVYRTAVAAPSLSHGVDLLLALGGIELPDCNVHVDPLRFERVLPMLTFLPRSEMLLADLFGSYFREEVVRVEVIGPATAAYQHRLDTHGAREHPPFFVALEARDVNGLLLFADGRRGGVRLLRGLCQLLHLAAPLLIVSLPGAGAELAKLARTGSNAIAAGIIGQPNSIAVLPTTQI